MGRPYDPPLNGRDHSHLRRCPVLTMGVKGFQDYIEKHCTSAVVPVELQKLARGSLVGGAGGGSSLRRPCCASSSKPTTACTGSMAASTWAGMFC